MSILCQMLGCLDGEFCCVRCGAARYTDDFIDAGMLSPAIWGARTRWGAVVHMIRGRECAQCKRRFRNQDVWERCCSDECRRDWVPF